MRQPTHVFSPLLLFLLLMFSYSDTKAASPGVGSSDMDRYFANEELLNKVFSKLANLENNHTGKVNIVHIGDSHIQADIFTNTIRESLQDIFGNGGYGFTFPYSLLRSNGTRSVRYVSDATWQSLLNVYPVADVGVGLSGIALYTSSSRFVVQLTAEEKYKFNTIKIIYPSEEPYFRMSVTADPVNVISTTSSATTLVSSGGGSRTHVVKKGEGLMAIARRYGVTVAQIKSANGMKSNTIHPGRTLKIPGKGKGRTTAKNRTRNRTKTVKVATIEKIDEGNLDLVSLKSRPYCSSYTCDTLLERIMILPDTSKFTSMYNLNGFVIENDKPGVIYHAIGVNGAKMSDYNKYPLFFKQLPLLEPDLIILSFGTNESFGKLSVSSYISHMDQFLRNVKAQNPNAVVLVMTPAPSLFRKGRPNPFIDDYASSLMATTYVPVWDLYSRMGGQAGIKLKGEYSDLIARDKVHYTSRGYQTQGSMFASDFIDAYNNFKKHRKH